MDFTPRRPVCHVLLSQLGLAYRNLRSLSYSLLFAARIHRTQLSFSSACGVVEPTAPLKVLHRRVLPTSLVSRVCAKSRGHEDNSAVMRETIYRSAKSAWAKHSQANPWRRRKRVSPTLTLCRAARAKYAHSLHATRPPAATNKTGVTKNQSGVRCQRIQTICQFGLVNSRDWR